MSRTVHSPPRDRTASRSTSTWTATPPYGGGKSPTFTTLGAALMGARRSCAAPVCPARRLGVQRGDAIGMASAQMGQGGGPGNGRPATRQLEAEQMRLRQLQRGLARAGPQARRQRGIVQHLRKARRERGRRARRDEKPGATLADPDRVLADRRRHYRRPERERFGYRVGEI